ncbi:ribonuclease 3 [Bodo saltans virus]|uniref:Ribonuclease 3 n=1 Tax=Bodo saltans virus TaxID=2024608 RepID=A0A2H4UV56_9VIRU|nr:ribonuclease 3 [Bodo saltans virus]ATZ80715.1 ribonuclease 3 [Bodo saltans virus]
MFNSNNKEIFKNGDFKNHILNEFNIPITENFLNDIFKKYDVDYKIKNLSNFQIAMTHVSYLKKSAIKEKTALLLKEIPPISEEKKLTVMPLQCKDYNTFEYQGDSVIHLILTQYLYKRYPNADIGFLTKLRTKLEKGEMLSLLSKILGFDKYVVIAKNMELNEARIHDMHLTEDIFEAFICALYIESSYDICYKFLINLLEKKIDFADLINCDDNYKEIIMQYFHKMKWKDPKYIESSLSQKNSMDILSQTYVILVQTENSDIIGVGYGNTKARAQQDAAHNALINLNLLKDDNTETFFDSNNIISKNNNRVLDDEEDKIDYTSWFLNGDFNNHILNEKNIFITENHINNIFKDLQIDHKILNINNYITGTVHVSYLQKQNLREKTALLLKDVPPIDKDKKNNAIELQKKDYSRLSHLGNAVIHLILTQYLSKRYSQKDQGFLTKLRTKIERAEALSILAKYLGLHKFAIIARNMELTDARENDSNLVKSLFESFIGTLSLETDFKICEIFFITLIEKVLDFADLLGTEDNFKEKIMQQFHKFGWKDPKYMDVTTEIDQKFFVVYVTNQKGEVFGMGEGNTKLKAEQNAALDALTKMNIDEKTDDNNFYGEVNNDDDFFEYEDD